VSTKKIKELRNLTKEELAAKLREAEAQLFDARMKHATGQLSDTASLWRLRKLVARAKTLQAQAAKAPASSK
jgi:large subunit ribosomal protein L29